MGKILNIGFLAIIVAVAARYFVSENLGSPFIEARNIQEWEIWLYSVSMFWFFLALWNTLIRRRCPKCKAYKYSFSGSEEIDRWVGSKKSERKLERIWSLFSKNSTLTSWNE